MRTFVAIVGCFGAATILVACQAATPTPAPSPTTTPASSASAIPPSDVSSRTPAPNQNSQSSIAIQNAICALVYHGQVQGGRCKATDVKVSAANPAWVYARIGVYDAQDQLASDSDLVMLNLTTHEVIGPTNVGFCGAGPDHNRAIVGYGAIPAAVLASLGLSSCTAPTGVSGSGPSTTSGVATSIAAFAATWQAHEMVLVIAGTGTGHLTYPDLTACPTCSEGTAPASTVEFVLTSVTNGVAAGRVTASSDDRNWAVGLPVQATLIAGSPGQLLDVKIGGKQLVAFCNGSSVGQCGA